MLCRSAVFLILVLLTGVDVVRAQSHGYVFFGPGGVTSDGYTSGEMYTGMGGEYVSRSGVGAGAEIGYTAPWRALGSGIGIGSVNGSWHFRRTGGVVPFVTAGYSLFFRNGHANGYNFGGGVNWWFSRKFGLRAEIRNHVGGGGLDAHLWAFRAGLTFR